MAVNDQGSLFGDVPAAPPSKATSFDPEAFSEEVVFEEDVEPPVPANEEPSQNVLFDKGEWWENHWKGMPEYAQKDCQPFKTIYVHFETRADMQEFAKLVNQTITLNTRSLWYPEADVNDFSKRYYTDSKTLDTNQDTETFED